MRQHAAVQSANGLLPFGHVGWGYRNRDEFFSRTAEYIADGLRHNQCITYASEGTHAALRSELAAMPGIGEHLDSAGIVVMPLEVFYIFRLLIAPPVRRVSGSADPLVVRVSQDARPFP